MNERKMAGPMRTIAVFNSKGGVGKTHFAYRVAALLARQGCKVLAVDADAEQESLLVWHDQAPEGFDAVTLQEYAVKMAEAARDGRDLSYDFLVVDSPPNHEAHILAALTDATVALMPVTPDNAVTAALPRDRRLIHLARQENPGLRVFAVLNAMEAGTKEARGELRAAVGASALVPAVVDGEVVNPPPGGWWTVLVAEVPRRVEIRRGFGGPMPAPGSPVWFDSWSPYAMVLAELGM